VIRRLSALLLLFASAALSAADLPQASIGTGGAVAAEEGIAAGVGIAILARGGNAADAAVAVAFALAVTWPEAGNIGGGGFWISRDAKGRVLTVDFRETAPRLARRDLFLAAPGRPTPSSTEGPLASGVPGSVAGLALAHRRAGKLPWKVVVEPAVKLARDGFPMTENIAASIAADRARLAKDPATVRIFLPGGAPPVVGAIFRQPDLAKTLAAIRDRGEDGFYRGEVARTIEEGQKATGGLITRGDLGRYEAKVRPALRFSFLGAEVFTTPAPSSGPVLAEMALAVALVPDRLRAQGAPAMHWLAEIEKRAFRDRNQFLGDPAFPGVDDKLFVDPARVKRLVASIKPDRATPLAALPQAFPEKPMTTHFSVTDGNGMVVAVTTTLNDAFGNARVAPGLGFLWNNEMDDFTVRPGETNMYGLVQGEANAVAPGKRMLSSMCPTIAVIPARGVFAWGAPGGSTIVTTNFQVLLGLACVRAARGGGRRAALPPAEPPDVVELEPEAFDPRGSWRSRPWAATKMSRATRFPERSGACTPSRRSRAAGPRPSRTRAATAPGSSCDPPVSAAELFRPLPGGTHPAAARPAAAARRRSVARARARARDPVAIRDMAVRGAPAIGVAAAYGPRSRCAAAPRRLRPNASTPRGACSPRRGRPPSTSSPRSSGWRAASPPSPAAHPRRSSAPSSKKPTRWPPKTSPPAAASESSGGNSSPASGPSSPIATPEPWPPPGTARRSA
jgi:gamma-glutamyltranspeptidase/glutathione hydrolase